MKTKTTSIKSIVTIVIVSVLFPIFIIAQSKPEYNLSKEIIKDKIAPSKVMGNQRVESGNGIVRAVYNPNFAVNSGEPKDMAEQYLNAFALPLLLKPGIGDLEHKRTIETLGGFKVQFIQKAAGYPVYGSEIKVSINRENKVVFVTNSYKPIGDLQTDINTSSESAILTSKNHIGILGKVSFEKTETIVYNMSIFKSVIAYKVNLVPAEDHFGDWELIVDASNGTILRAEDKACYYHPEEDEVQANGLGWVFDPDPVTNAKTLYGAPQFIDNNDEDSDALTAQLKTVTLQDITYTGSMYRLEGPYAAIDDIEGPFTGLYEQASSNFYYTRSNEAFEAVNSYFHLDKSMRYINNTLGFDVTPFQYEGGVRFDPHGLDGANNAHYLLSTGKIAFGSHANYVDSGEDHSIVIHELGHGLHDWITNGGLSQVDGLSEGLSDYWAQSYTRSLGIFEPGDEAYDYFGVWGLQPLSNPYLRVTNSDLHYPEDKDLEIHISGQMWSSSLMSIYDLIGREATDMDCWEGISMLNGSSSQVDAAYAFSQADKELFDGDHLEDIYNVFYERGYLQEPVIPLFTADKTNGQGPRDVDFTDWTLSFFGDIDSWEWDFNYDGIIDSYDQNPSYTFTDVGAYSISLTVSAGELTKTLVKENYITVNGGFFIFEASENQQDYSGAVIRDFLVARGYDVIYSNYYPSTLAGFDAAFLSFGNGGENLDQATLLEYENTLPIQNYLKGLLQDGGKLYTDGSPFLSIPGYYNFPNGNEFINLFGVESITTSPDTPPNPISKLTGLEETINDGMIFNNSNQQINWYIDQIVAAEGATLSFNEEGYGNVSVYNEGEYGQKTFHFGYSLGELVDEDPHSSRYNILLKILEFFGYPEGDGYVVANFLADQTEGEPGLEVQFTDWSIVDEGYEITGWAWDFNEDGEFDSYDQNPVWTYNEGGVFDVKLVVFNDVDTDTLVKKDLVSIRSGILVYEGQENTNGYSGTFIRDYLEENWYPEVGYTNSFPSSLDGYDVVFLSFGNLGFRGTTLTTDMATAIFDFAQDGGTIYIEGEFATNLFKVSNYATFGLQGFDDGENNAIDGLIGEEDASTAGMQFNLTNQLSVRSIDKYIEHQGLSDAKIAFQESDYGTVAVEYDGSQANGQKTFCMSYSLADLEDGEGSNTRSELLKRILNFFDVTVGVEEPAFEESNAELKLFPNPASDQVTLEFSIEEESTVIIEIFDLSGRKISEMTNSFSEGAHQIDFNIEEYSSGLHYISVRTNEMVETIKWIKVD